MLKLAMTALAICTTASVAMADMLVFSVAGITNAANTAAVEFSYLNGTATIKITNTSAIQSGTGQAAGPQITAFTFNVPANVTGISSFSGPTGWDDLFGLNGQNLPQVGSNYDVCATTNNCPGGQPGPDALAPGDVGNFTFVFSGSNLNSLTASSFLGILTTNQNPNYFGVRFQRTDTNGNGSDVGIPTTPPNPPQEVVPEPTSMALFGTALAGLGLLYRRRRA